MNDESMNQDGLKSHNRIVAFVDILGASQAVLSGDSVDLVTKIFQMGKKLKWKNRIHFSEPDGTMTFRDYKPGIAQFSDCLLLWSNPLDGLEPAAFSRAADSFLWNLCEEMGRLLLADIPFRAGVSEGPVYIYPDYKIYVGRPIVEAVKLEASQNWLGAAMLFSESPDRLIRQPDQVLGIGEISEFSPYVLPSVQVPMKSDVADCLSSQTIAPLNWALSAQGPHGPNYHTLQEKLKFLRSRCSHKVKDKYQAAENFLAAIEKCFPSKSPT